MLADGEPAMLDNEEGIHLAIPLACHMLPREIVQRGYRLLTESPDDVRRIWRSLGVKDSQFAAAWPKWVKHCKRWLMKMSQYVSHVQLVHGSLLEDVRPEEGR